MDRISIAANALIDAQNTNTPLKEFPSLSAPRTAEEAFSIQDAVLEKKEEHRKKRKRSHSERKQRRQLMAVENMCPVAKKVES